ncbi:alpha-2-macroglobulin family protein [Stigmatella sp. ncwal1]|uniref:Alpha-2-macroglobulin family protein n=1 Tax=Stigmatella ashevillensis TaxID=2995309 RepID=A0ABT5D919_9BACT|nr:alpha-2-macroglobulin family protein [Stigmatella ashevillena]MDC0710168.1 alpha-2-macroglobulin family protein [Stigmatella ashevillena]
MSMLHRVLAWLPLLLLATLMASAPARAQDKAPSSWEAIEQLIQEQDLKAAEQGIDARLAQAVARGDEDEWARALIRKVQLRMQLDSPETAVRYLREQPWPKGLLPRAALQLFYAQSLVFYAEVARWELADRERVESLVPVDLKQWTRAQIITEAHRALADVWRERERLGNTPVRVLAEYIEPSDYPEGIRSTLRDAVAYLWVDLLSNTSTGRPEQLQELSSLDLGALLAGTPTVELTDPAVHRLSKTVAILGDLEAWHRNADRREAELEARLVRYQRLHEAFSQEEDRTRIRQHLAAHLEGFRAVPWWAMGQGLLAELEREAEHQVRAHHLAKEGVAAYPKSLGGKRCATLIAELEAPEYSLGGMRSDGPLRRSIEVMHRNVPVLFFRAYPYELEKRLARLDGDELLPDGDELTRLISRQKPTVSWTTELPATPDFQHHRTFVTPPLSQPGLYLIVASMRSDFGETDNRVEGMFLTVTPYTLIARSDQENRIELRVVDGKEGRPASGVEARLFLWDFERGLREMQHTRTDSQGEATFIGLQGATYRRFLVVVGRGRNALLLQDPMTSSGRGTGESEGNPSGTTRALIYTDRSAYRPLQKILWKVVAFRGDDERSRYQTRANLPVTVSLFDPNGQVAGKQKVRTNAFGSAAGEFSIPAGRLLGRWRISTDIWGWADVRVEEYKRPTFEVKLKDPSAALRLNRTATFRGEARYHFGFPVTNGSVRWRVSREPVGLEGWGWHQGSSVPPEEPPLVATGTSPLKEDGSFEVSFTPDADEREAKLSAVTWRYRVEADVKAEGGETRSVSRAFRLGFVAVEVRLEADRGFFSEGAPAEFRLLRSNLDGAPQPGKGNWRLVELQQPAQPVLPADEPILLPPGERGGEERMPTPGDALRPRWVEEAFSPEATLSRWMEGAEQAKGTVEHDAEGLVRLKLPVLKPGAYRLLYETVDAFGQKFTTAREFLVAGASAPIALPAVLILERKTVKVGDTARLLAFSGFEGQTLFLEVYQGTKRIQRRQLTRGKDPAVIEMPVTEALRGGFTVSLVGVRDYQLLRFVQPVSVPFDNKELSIEFTSFRDRLRPGEKETWRVTVRGPKGGPVEAGAAELLAYMYDQALDLFAPHEPLLGTMFYGDELSEVELLSSLGAETARQVRGEGLGVSGWFYPKGDRLLFLENNNMGGPGGWVRRVLEQKRREIIQVIKGSSANALPQPVPPSAPVRSDFAETAFWIPQLLTEQDGSATLEFTVPDSVTAWSAWVHAVTRDMKGGSLQRTARSVKELMVRPYVPRFLREGDKAVLEVVVNNASERRQEGTLTLDILDPETEKSVLSRFGVANASQPFTVEPGRGITLRFPLSTPAQLETVAVRVTARAGPLGDGELRPMPVLPGRLHLSQSRFVTLRDKDRKELTFDDLRRNDDPTRINGQLTVTVDAQLFSSVLQALPYLVDYPYECTEQTLNRFVSTGIVSSLYGQYPAVAKMAKAMSERATRLGVWDSADPNRHLALEETPWLQEAKGGPEAESGLLKVLDPAVAKAQRQLSLTKLAEAQTVGGGFPWWPGGPPSPFMTLYIAHGLARAAEYQVEFPKELTQGAWRYLARYFREESVNKQMEEDQGWEFLTFLNYVASSYPDASYMGDALSADERKRILDFSFKHWKEHSPYLKGYLALTLKRAGRVKDAERVWESVMGSAKTSPELGTFWAPEDRSWLWYNDTTETQAFALRTLTELKPKDPRREGLVQWLLLDKKLNHWKSTRATAEALYALVGYLRQEGALGIREEAKVTVGDKTVEFVFAPDTYTGKKNQVLIPGAEVDPVKSSTVVVEKSAKGFAFASATWQFSTERLPVEERGDFFQVSRRYFLRKREGTEATLRPLAEGAKLVPGDEVEVHLSLRTKHASEYVHLKDPRAAGLEPEGGVSRHKQDLGIAWYEETRDSGTNFFFEWLPVGEYTFKYRLRANMAGTFRVGPATVQSLYAPEFTAYSTGAVLTVDSAR